MHDHREQPTVERSFFCWRRRIRLGVGSAMNRGLQSHGREAAVDVIGCAGNEAACCSRQQEQDRPDKLFRFAKPGHRRLLHDMGRSLGIQNLAILLRGEKPWTQGVRAGWLCGANSRATLRVRLTTAAFEAE